MFCNFIEDFNGDYPKFQSWDGMDTIYKRLVGKKFSHMCLSNIRGREGLYVYFRRRVKGIAEIIIQNATDLYNVFGEEQALILCNIVKKRIEADEQDKQFYESNRKSINEKLRISKNTVADELTYEKFMEEFQRMKNPSIHFEYYVDSFNGDYPKFQSWDGMNIAYRTCVGKKLKTMHIVTNIAGRKELHVEFTRRINGTTGIIIENTNDLYNFLGEEQVFEIYNIIKNRIADQNI